MALRNLSILWFPLLSLILLTASCQNEESATEDTIKHFAFLDVRYLAPGQELRGQAIFTQGDSVATATPLVIPGGAAFMGSGMREKKIFDDRIRYEATLNMGYPDSLQFRYRRQEDAPWVTSILKMSPIDSFRVLTASKQNGISVEVGASVALEERLVLLFTDPNGEARTIVRLGPLSDKVIFIPADNLQHYIPGSYDLYLVKIKEREVQEGDWLVHQHLEYYTAAQNFTLSE